MSRWEFTKQMLKTSLPTAAAVVAVGAAGVAAGASDWTMRGSDTLFEVITDAISAAHLTAQLYYKGSGSGNGETDLNTGVGLLAPMSRNFKSSIVGNPAASGSGADGTVCHSLNPDGTLRGDDDCLPGLYCSVTGVEPGVQRTGVCSTPTPAKTAWRPGIANVVGLDAGLLVTKNDGSGFSACANLELGTINPNTGYAPKNSILGLILGGKDGLGTTAACAAPERIAAIQALQDCFTGIGDRLQHFYRRDDSSGTSDTFKERLQIQAFCNGASDTNWPPTNLNARDADPIRRPCVKGNLGGLGTRNPTKCTVWPSNTQCSPTVGDPGYDPYCTQGFLVSLSEIDPGQADVTRSIAYRVYSDPTGQTVGYAGMAAVSMTGGQASAPYLNNISYSVDNVRLNQYFMSRRLYVNKGSTATGTFPSVRYDDEMALWDWITDKQGTSRDRCNIDPLISTYGFLTCTDDCGDYGTPGTTLCAQTPFATALSTPKNCLLPGETCNTAMICCSTGRTCSTGICADEPLRATGEACDKGADCISGVCTDNGQAKVCG